LLLPVLLETHSVDNGFQSGAVSGLGLVVKEPNVDEVGDGHHARRHALRKDGIGH